LQLLNLKDINLLCFNYINIWGILPLKDITSELIYQNINEVKSKIEFLMNVSIALSGLLLSLVTLISYFIQNVQLRRKSCFKKKEIFQTGKDDIAIMIDYFTNANFVAVYSHSFSWLNNNEQIRRILTELAQKSKLKLYTGDNIESVVARLDKCDSNLISCIQEAGSSLRFSYIERDNSKYLLYRQEQEDHTHVIIVRENNESQYLLQVTAELVK